MEHLLLIEDDQALGRGITLALAPLGTGSPIWPGLWPRAAGCSPSYPSPWSFWISICPTGTAWNC